LEIAALIYPRNSITGDVFGTSNVLPDFSQFGKHLYETGGVDSSSTAFYRLNNYQFNPLAQAAWRDDIPSKNQTMNQTIARLRSDGKSLNDNHVVIGNLWNEGTANFDGICGNTATCAEANQYPNGRTWYNSRSGWSLKIAPPSHYLPNPLQYDKKSTLILDLGSVEINSSVQKKNVNSSFGIIVTAGDVYIKNRSPYNKMTFEASIFVPSGNIYVIGHNIDLIGSFVAKDFIINSGSSGYNINFIQDTREENIWPPGFRDLQPLAQESR